MLGCDPDESEQRMLNRTPNIFPCFRNVSLFLLFEVGFARALVPAKKVYFKSPTPEDALNSTNAELSVIRHPHALVHQEGPRNCSPVVASSLHLLFEHVSQTTRSKTCVLFDIHVVGVRQTWPSSTSPMLFVPQLMLRADTTIWQETQS